MPLAPSPESIARFRADLEALAGPARGRLGVALSGGPDSLALLLLASATFPGAVAAATVDHGLRAESAAEAQYAGRVCGGLGVPHAILAADEKVTGNLQSAARALRYRLLGRWAAGEGIAFLLTAHHADDQAETLIMRLRRGAGLPGLSGIRARGEIGGAMVLRPLLGWTRAELAAIAAAAGLDPVDDPSNRDTRYDRARLRSQLAGAAWLDPAAFARSAAALAEGDEALGWATERLFEQRAAGIAGGGLTLDPAGIPAELRRRLVLAILSRLGGAEPPRGAGLQRLLTALDAGSVATLAGVKCEGGALWHFTPETPRRAA